MNNQSKAQALVPVQQESEGFVTGTVSKGFRWKCFVILSIHFLFFLKRFHIAIKRILTHARFLATLFGYAGQVAQDTKTQREAIFNQFKKYFGSLGLCVNHSLSTAFNLWLRWKCFVLIRFCFLVMIGIFGTVTIHAQGRINVSFDPVPVSSYYYAVEFLETGDIVRRGFLRIPEGEARVPFLGLILAPDTNYRYWLYEIETGLNGFVRFTSAPSGRRTTIPPVPLGPSLRPDSDLDGLDDEAEFIIGTNALSEDTDDDGILDGAEIEQGLDPLEGLLAFTGIISAVDTPGSAVDVAAFNDAVAIADGSNGISVFNVFNGMDPLIVAQVDTPGNARAVAFSVNDSGSFVAVADGNAGLAIIDITDPPSAQIVHQIDLPGTAQALSATADRVFVGTANGSLSEVYVIDVLTGGILDKRNFDSDIQDVFLAGDYLYVLRRDTLQVLEYLSGPLTLLGTASSPGLVNTNNGRMRLFVGGGIAYAVHNRGYNTIDVNDPTFPLLINHPITPQFGWKQIVLNGSGLGLAAVSPNQAFDGPHHVSVYNTTMPTITDSFITEFPTPGVARSVAIYNGLCYVADNTRGLQVINYLAFDNFGIPPTISIELPFGNNQAEEGKLFRVTADVEDDVQVRNVEFYVDGVLVATDGNFPFEYRFVTPLIENQLTFRVQARASDTGGNATFSEEVTVTLVPDATPPRLVSRLPFLAALGGGSSEVAAFFNEPMDVSSFGSGNFFVEEAGPDTLLGTADDVLLSGLSFSYREESNGAFLAQASDFAPGKYQVTVQNVTDLVGNALESTETWTFTIFDIGIDGDGDGVPDDVEALLGLDPADSDSDDDGIPDGLEDFDGDGLVNFAEIVLSADPTSGDSDDDGILDGDEDADSDGLVDKNEFAQGTDPFLIDSDGDEFSDSDEVANGSSPLNSQSVPLNFVIGPSFSVFNSIDPSVDLVLDFAIGPSFSVFNSIDPSVDLVLDFAIGPSFSVFNSIDPSAGIVLDFAIGPSFSVFNAIDPDIEVDQAIGPSFSVENQIDP